MPPKPQHEVHGQDANAAIRINYDSCIGCQACARACSDAMALYVMKGSKPKFPPIVSPTHGVEDTTTETTRVRLADSDCIGCGQCVVACAFNALRPESKIQEIFAAKRAGKKIVAVLSPSVRVGIAEAMGMPCGKSAEAQLIVHLRKMGFDYVFDNLWGADGTTTEDAKEMLKAKQQGAGTVFTSCCPAWVRLVETRYPELIPQLSTARSPHGIVCSAIRNFWVPDMGFKQEDVVVVGMMPCTAKKFEAERTELTTDGHPDCNISVTTRELGEYFTEQGYKFTEEQEEALRGTQEAKCDEPFAQVSGGAYIFGKTAGVAETVVRYIFSVHGEKFDPSKLEIETYWEHKDKTQNIKIIKFELDGTKYRFGVSHGGQALVQMLKVYKDLNLDGVEVMMCPLGCQNGGGQPRQARLQVTVQRQQGLEKHDRESKFGSCYDNQQYVQYIKDHIKDEHGIHKYLHTHFTDRSK